MHLEYGTLISAHPIKLSIGTIKKPTLDEISQLSFGTFSFFELLMDITPRKYYVMILKDTVHEAWDSLSEDQQESVTMYDMIQLDEELRELYTNLFRFFFVERVIFESGYFLILEDDYELGTPITDAAVRGIIYEKNFAQVLEVLQQICGIQKKEESAEPKFKNKKAREIYEKIQKGQEKAAKKHDINLSIPNIISAVACKHPSLNLTNIWNLTIFQLLDSFNRLQSNAIYDIDSARVSTWGDEKKTFDIALWYKNYFDKTDQS